MPLRHAGADFASARARAAAPATRPVTTPIVLPLESARRYRGRLRRLQQAAPVALRERITRELRQAGASR